MTMTITELNLKRWVTEFAAKTSEEPGELPIVEATTAGGEPPPYDHNHTTNTMTEWWDSRVDDRKL